MRHEDNSIADEKLPQSHRKNLHHLRPNHQQKRSNENQKAGNNIQRNYSQRDLRLAPRGDFGAGNEPSMQFFLNDASEVGTPTQSAQRGFYE